MTLKESKYPNKMFRITNVKAQMTNECQMTNAKNLKQIITKLPAFACPLAAGQHGAAGEKKKTKNRMNSEC
jgi:hypothetical protein